MIFTKSALIIVPLAFVWVAFTQTKATHVKAYQRILFISFIIFIIFTLVDPVDIRTLARHIGFTSGTALIVYVLVIAFLFSIIATYLKFNEMSQKIVSLSRHIALLDSTQGAGERKKSKRKS